MADGMGIEREAPVERVINAVNEAIGRTVSWLIVAMVVLQMAVVVFRYVFGLGDPVAQDLILYMHAIAFMTLAGYALRHDAHVRVDLVYREKGERYKGLVDLLGTLVFLWPMAGVMIWKSWPYVADAWAIREGAARISGIQGAFILKTFLLVFAALLALQGVALFVASLRRLGLVGRR
jgi:TRAP-type mannitol/chloroaromatic compound transport system permease small subunit